MSIGAAVGSIGKPSPQSMRVARYPAPVGGIDTRVALGAGNLNNCVYTYNLVPYEFGMQVRQGYREWQIGVDNGNNLGIHTIIPFDGINAAGVGDKLFVVNNEGIWDVTVAGDPPILALIFADDDVTAGYGPFTHYVNDAEDDVLFYADSVNGQFFYDADLNTWAQPAGITGPDITKVRFVVSHKQRLWMIEQNSTSAWYLPVGSIAGAATQFFFGSKFKHGGSLEGLFNWSVDGGAGLDDILVAVSHAGDVLPYKGADPSSASTWDLIGTYYIGEVPEGPFFASEQGGELFLLSSFGLSSMDDLLKGVDTNVLQANVDNASRAQKVAATLRERMVQTVRDPGWAVLNIPSEGGFLITLPNIYGSAPIQLYYNMASQGWGMWRDVPMTAIDNWKNTVVFGTEDGRVMRMDVGVDNFLLTPPAEPLVNGDDINFSILTSFSTMEQDALYKKVRLIRPDFLSNYPITYRSTAHYDYDIREPGTAGLRTPADLGIGVWDLGTWDSAVWGTSTLQVFNSVGGSWDYGRAVAIATIGKTRTRTRLIGWDLSYQSGGFML